ncbi:hypothetical protein BDU57DRAFT_515853 [Ampelomyces quisqualis]|uniref:Uncharacterized protein n=1 Tax=Ampelomyces quisqualis TaxID=50730 RepID=A0A6A5QNC9_AMPQU|nr:hypothetical protein BDU57DRAFT_515853 [Ampelomyces quisqualis]
MNYQYAPKHAKKRRQSMQPNPLDASSPQAHKHRQADNRESIHLNPTPTPAPKRVSTRARYHMSPASHHLRVASHHLPHETSLVRVAPPYTSAQYVPRRGKRGNVLFFCMHAAIMSRELSESPLFSERRTKL